MQALKVKDEEMRRELEGVKRNLEEKIEEIWMASKMMLANSTAEKEGVEARMREMEQEVKEGERAKAEYNWNPAVPTGSLQRPANASAEDRAGWRQEIRELQDHIVIPIC